MLRHAPHVLEDDVLLQRIFPIGWFGFLAVFILVALRNGLRSGPDFESTVSVILPVLMAIIGYRFMKKQVFNLVDEVFDGGDALLVRSGGREERIALADSKRQLLSLHESPQVTLSLRRLTVFGDTIVFLPPSRMKPLSCIDDPVDRIDAARRGH